MTSGEVSLESFVRHWQLPKRGQQFNQPRRLSKAGGPRVGAGNRTGKAVVLVAVRLALVWIEGICANGGRRLRPNDRRGLCTYCGSDCPRPGPLRHAQQAPADNRRAEKQKAPQDCAQSITDPNAAPKHRAPEDRNCKHGNGGSNAPEQKPLDPFNRSRQAFALRHSDLGTIVISRHGWMHSARPANRNRSMRADSQHLATQVECSEMAIVFCAGGGLTIL